MKIQEEWRGNILYTLKINFYLIEKYYLHSVSVQWSSKDEAKMGSLNLFFYERKSLTPTVFEDATRNLLRRTQGDNAGRDETGLRTELCMA